MAGEESDDAEDAVKAEQSTCGWKFQQAQKLKFLAVLFTCLILKHVANPSIPYITNTFFAASHGGGDCEATPESKPCQQGAADTAYVNSILDGGSHVMAMLMAVLLGSCSDRVGRQPVLRLSSVLSALVFSALALHVERAWSLWFYLLGNAVAEGFDINGVFISLIMDMVHLIPNEAERKAAAGMFCIVFVPLMICSIAVGFLATHERAVLVSLTAAGVQVVYMFTFFPETMPKVAEKDPPVTGLCTVVRDVQRVFLRNTVIQRMALVIALYGCAIGASGVIFPPFMTGRLGIKKADKLKLAVAALPSMLAAGALWQRVVDRLGIVRVLQISVLSSALSLASCLLCRSIWQLMVVLALFMGPVAWGFPAMVKIKSSLVAWDEQGTAQGATAGISKGSAFLGIVLMGQLFRYSTRGGKDLQQGLALPFLVDAGIYLAAFLLSLSLPVTLPPTPTAAKALHKAGASSGDELLTERTETDSSSMSDASSTEDGHASR